jgi:hypothetical protein
MKKVNKDFREIEILKERHRLRLLEQEIKIKASFSELTDNLTGVALLNKVKDNLVIGSGLAFKLGYMAVTLLRNKLSRKGKK